MKSLPATNAFKKITPSTHPKYPQLNADTVAEVGRYLAWATVSGQGTSNWNDDLKALEELLTHTSAVEKKEKRREQDGKTESWFLGLGIGCSWAGVVVSATYNCESVRILCILSHLTVAIVAGLTAEEVPSYTHWPDHSHTGTDPHLACSSVSSQNGYILS